MDKPGNGRTLDIALPGTPLKVETMILENLGEN